MADCWIDFELTNDQRRCFALEPVEPDWEKIELKPNQFDLYDTFAYLSGSTIRKLICVGERIYAEQSFCEAVTEDGQFLLPKTSKGKPVPLTAANALKRTPRGMALLYSNSQVSVTNRTAQQDYFRSAYVGISLPVFSEFEDFVEKWCRETDPQKQADLDAFARLPRIHQKYREGDFFRFRLNRSLFGYGRILLDYSAMRKNKVPFWEIFMGKPLCVSVYRIATERTDCRAEELAALPSLPSTMVMDNIFYYGECEIIGNLPLQPEDEDYPIHYGQSISIGDSSLCYQRGKTFLTLPNEKELFPGFRNGQIGWQLNVCLPILLECIQADSNLPYWNQTRDFIIREDLRNPKYRALLEQVQAQFHNT